MTVKEAIELGYKTTDSALFRGYVSRKTIISNQAVKEAAGRRKGLLFYEAPNWKSTKYSYRVYLSK